LVPGIDPIPVALPGGHGKRWLLTLPSLGLSAEGTDY
jgi:hypothetical protein